MNNGTIPRPSRRRCSFSGASDSPPRNYTAGVVLDRGQFSVTADYFRISVSDRIGITSNFTLTNTEIDGLLAAGVEAARDHPPSELSGAGQPGRP